jgi:hypothetical protein
MTLHKDGAISTAPAGGCSEIWAKNLRASAIAAGSATSANRTKSASAPSGNISTEVDRVTDIKKHFNAANSAAPSKRANAGFVNAKAAPFGPLARS